MMMGNVIMNVMESDAVFWWATIFRIQGAGGVQGGVERNGSGVEVFRC